MQPLVSVVITTKNEEKNIANCLESIKAQSYPTDLIEIIVVDNYSSDKTKEIALRYTGQVFDKGPERSAQRNYGMIDKAGGEYVMFVDADMILAPGLIAAAVESMADNDCAALHIPEIVLGRNYFSRVRRFERSFYNGTAIDGARFFKKDIFVAVGGFDESLSGPEDWDIDKKIKAANKVIKLLNDKDNNGESVKNWNLNGFIKARGADPEKYGSVIYHNETEFNLRRYLDKKGYYAKSFDNYLNKWGKDDRDVKKQLGMGYRFFGVFTENGKWKRLLSHPILAMGMYFLRGMVGVVFLIK